LFSLFYIQGTNGCVKKFRQFGPEKSFIIYRYTQGTMYRNAQLRYTHIMYCTLWEECKQTQCPQDVSEHQDVAEHQDVPEHQYVPEHQDVAEHQDSPEHQDVSEHQDISEHQDVSEQQDVPEHQDVYEHQDVPEYQDIAKNRGCVCCFIMIFVHLVSITLIIIFV